mgnify:CR=1 FL=1
MIYIIFDQSYECDGYDYSSNIIKYISTDKEEAIAFFDKYFSNPLQNDKWHYEYELIEFEDGCNFFQQGKQTTLRHTCNDEPEDEWAEE